MLDQILNFVQNSLLTQVGVVSMVVEIALRLVKTEQPRTIATAVCAGLKKIISILTGLDSFLDKVIPQKLK